MTNVLTSPPRILKSSQSIRSRCNKKRYHNVRNTIEKNNLTLTVDRIQDFRKTMDEIVDIKNGGAARDSKDYQTESEQLHSGSHFMKKSASQEKQYDAKLKHKKSKSTTRSRIRPFAASSPFNNKRNSYIPPL